MKKFLIKTIIFLSVVYACAWGLDYAICQGLLRMEDSRFQDYSQMLQGGMKNDVVILGSSRAKHHYNTAIIDSVCNCSSFNLGAGGYPLNIALLKYQLYCEHNDAPRLIVLNMDYATMKILPDVCKQHESEQFFPLIYDKVMRKELRELGYGILELNFPLYRMFGYQEIIKKGLLEFLHVKHHVSSPSYKGYVPLEGEWDGTLLAKRTARDAEVTQESWEKLDDFLAQRKAEGVEVLMVNSPQYVGAINIVTNYSQIDSVFHNMAHRYQFQYINYNMISEINQDTANFTLAAHLNPIAADSFTVLLCDTISSFLPKMAGTE